MRLERALRDGSIDLGWLERAFINASIPDHIAILILLIAIDTTAFPGWHLTQRYEHEADVRRDLRKRYREIHGEIRPIPEMDTPEMRAFAEKELGIIIGKDGRMLRCHADPDLRGGYKTPTPKRPQELYSGYASHVAVAAHLPTADDGDDAHMPAYITAATTTAANAGPRTHRGTPNAANPRHRNQRHPQRPRHGVFPHARDLHDPVAPSGPANPHELSRSRDQIRRRTPSHQATRRD